MNNTQFEWQADEDEDLGKPSQQTGRSGRNYRLWIVIGFILLTGIVTLLLVRLFTQRQRQLEEIVRQDVRVSYNLWQEAVERKDSELYDHLLAAEDGNWRRMQNRLFVKDILLDRPFLGLAVSSEAPSAPEIELAPDWQQATVSFEQIYSPPVSSIGGMVRLHHTAVYELHDSTWLQIPPDATFWGEWQTYEGDLLTVRYPARDAALAQRISRQLEADLQAVCSERNEGDTDDDHVCARVEPFILKMSTEMASLNALDSALGPMLYGRVYQLPTPTLVGLPADELSYQAFYQGYTRKIVEDVRTAVNPPLSLPQQVIRTLCFDHPNVGPRLYKYDPALGTWEAELSDRSFRFLQSLPKDQGLILGEIGDLESWHTRLIHWQAGSEELLLDEALNEESYRVLTPPNGAGPYLLLRYVSDNQLTVRYSSLDLRSCSETECNLGELPGYALWSPGGQQTIIQIGSEIYQGDAGGQIQTLLGTGFNPFWLDDKTTAYIQFLEQDSGLITALVMNQIALGSEQTLFDTNDLAKAAGINEDELSIRYVTPNPADPNLLLVHASGLNAFAGEYFIFTVRLPVDRLDDTDAGILFHLQRAGSPGGDANQVTPTGFLPFSPSPDGRWLVISELSGYDSASRTSILYDLYQNQTAIISAGDPVYPAQYPSYDWSDDGRWLVITGDGFFRIIAPGYDYEQLVPHDFDYCTFINWSNR